MGRDLTIRILTKEEKKQYDEGCLPSTDDDYYRILPIGRYNNVIEPFPDLSTYEELMDKIKKKC